MPIHASFEGVMGKMGLVLLFTTCRASGSILVPNV